MSETADARPDNESIDAGTTRVLRADTPRSTEETEMRIDTDDGLFVEIESHAPHRDPIVIDCDEAEMGTREVNQYSLWESFLHSESGAMSSELKRRDVIVVARDSDAEPEWKYATPRQDRDICERANHRLSDEYTPDDYIPDRLLEGVEIRTLTSRDSRRETHKRERIKVTRDAAEQYDELYVVKMRIKKSEGPNGESHNRIIKGVERVVPE